jgi:hypothetical protein
LDKLIKELYKEKLHDMIQWMFTNKYIGDNFSVEYFYRKLASSLFKYVIYHNDINIANYLYYKTGLISNEIFGDYQFIENCTKICKLETTQFLIDTVYNVQRIGKYLDRYEQLHLYVNKLYFHGIRLFNNQHCVLEPDLLF